jgi:beta-aspartyl-peptidase (threonine type)
MLLLAAACAGPSDEALIRRVLDDQVEAWNRGDLEGFMEGYWKSDELVFRSGAKEERGWQATLDRYRTAYPTREAMGRLSFTELVVTPPEATGRWRLQRATDAPGGTFRLLLRRFPEGWRIVRDETTAHP